MARVSNAVQTLHAIVAQSNRRMTCNPNVPMVNPTQSFRLIWIKSEVCAVNRDMTEAFPGHADGFEILGFCTILNQQADR